MNCDLHKELSDLVTCRSHVGQSRIRSTYGIFMFRVPGASVRSPSGPGCLGLDSEYLPHCTTSPRAPQDEESLLPMENKAISWLHRMRGEINTCGARCRRRKKKGSCYSLFSWISNS